MVIHISKDRFHSNPKKEVILENFISDGEVVTKVNERIISLLESAYENNTYIEVGSARFLVSEMVSAVIGEDREAIKFKMESVEKV